MRYLWMLVMSTSDFIPYSLSNFTESEAVSVYAKVKMGRV
jgi:hypothetical protein